MLLILVPALSMAIGRWAQAAPTSKVLLCYDGGDSYAADVQTTLKGTGRFAQVDLLRVSNTTPSSAQLNAYDSVLTWNDGGYGNSTALGDALADYVDSGHRLAVATFAFIPSANLQGRFATGSYLPFTTGNDTSGTPLTLVKDLPNDPLLKGVNSFNGGSSSFYCKVNLAAGATQVAHWSNNVPLVAKKQLTSGAGTVVGLNFFPVSSNNRSDFWDASTDGAALLANALSPSNVLKTNEDSAGSGTLDSNFAGNAPLTYSIVTQGSKGVVTLTDAATGAYTYVPNANENGSDSFAFQVSDGTSTSEITTVNVTINPVDDAPSFAVGTNQIVDEDAAAQSVADFATKISAGPENESEQKLNFVVTNDNPDLFATAPAIAPDGTLSYALAANANGVAKISVKLQDDGGTDNGGVDTSAEQTFTITVNAVNDAPVALDDDSYQTDEDATLAVSAADGVLKNDSDVDNASLKAVLESDVSNGTLTLNDDGSFAYAPNANFNGSDSFTYRANDGSLNSDIVSVTLKVNAVNDAPVAVVQSVTADEDASKSIELTASDVDKDALTYRIVDGPTHGKLTGEAPNVTYAPNADFNGEDSFTFVANDGIVDSAPVKVSIAVNSVNDAPSFTVGENQNVDEDAAAQTISEFANNINAGADNENGQTVKFNVSNDNADLFAVAPAIDADGTLTYTLAANANGVAKISVKLQDDGGTANGGADTSAVQTFTITVNAVNDAPVADAQSVATDEDASKTIELTANDVDKDALTYRIVGGPTHGKLTGAAPNVTYAPDADFNGDDSFTFVANDGTVDSAPVTVAIAVNSVNDAPVAIERSESVDRNLATEFTLRATDVDSTNLTYTIVNGPTVGTISGTAPNLTYTPLRGYTGADSLTFRVDDGQLDSDVATVQFVVGANNEAPVAFSQKVATDEDKALDITLNANDSNGDDVAYDVVNAPAHGTLTGTAPNLTYTPEADFNGADSFTFSANDGTVDGNIATVSINVNAINDAPSFAIGAEQTVDENAGSQSVAEFATQISAGPADENGQKLNFVVTNDNEDLFAVAPAIAADGTLTYTLAPKAAGKATISVMLHDDGGTDNGGADTSAVQTFAINVTANPLYIGVSMTPAGPFTNDTVTATPRITDADGVTYNYEWFVNGVSVQNGAGNTLDLSKPGKGDKGDKVSVTLSAKNKRGGAGTATNGVIVRNSVPFAFSGTATAKSGVETVIPFRPFGNPGGGDSDLEAVTYKRVGGPKNGTGGFVTNADGSIDLHYTSRLGFTGVEAIRFVAVDELGRTSNVATLGINVTGGLPTAQDVSGQTTSGVSVDVPLSGNDPNGGAVTFKRVGGPRNGTGGLVTLPDGSTVMRYIPRANFVGVEEIRYVALSASGHPSNVATISITVSASANTSGASALQTGDAPSAGNS